ncbi:MAG: SDR family oxidoreductase [Bacteroidetes bacterium]|nr:SDR family oxidoreductase [Bacteroidota bacterium]MBU1484443.1 SDR family oxidoreductase [Bacteroidota bacterium]MBU2046475.1 SDR family oxidoreductase [Bacteroidota bacterium]MBU2269001.1 SDR family oxidoreductase [Bacteroidota bacterium]MBU2376404.1 SDR family oxidoreductase [Bacteroidota bacterium]
MQTTSLEDQQVPQKVIITGASSGIGFETAIDLAVKGHEVIALARSKEKLENLQKITLSLHPDAKIFAIVFDILNDDLTALIDFVKQVWGDFNILINNAGKLINKPFKETGELDMVEMFHMNVMGHFRMIKALTPLMTKKSHIVNIGSMGGYQGSAKFPGLSAYSASKSALHTLTECLAQELVEDQISVNCLALGSAQTEMLEQAFPGYQSPVQAFEMGQYIASFALTGHRFFNGKILPVALSTP